MSNEPGPPAFDPATAAAAIEAAIQAAANPARAATEKRYLKSDLVFHGAGVPAVRAAVATLLRANPGIQHGQLLALCAALWSRPFHECRLAAVVLLERRASLLEASDVPLLEALVRESRTWALVDELATGPVALLASADPAGAAWLDRWSCDPDFWVRRAALLALLPGLRGGGGDWERFARYAEALLDEREFFIRKAIGWVLRETSKKRPSMVAAWLLPRAADASGVTVREAVHYLDPADREAILAAHRAGGRSQLRA